MKDLLVPFSRAAMLTHDHPFTVISILLILLVLQAGRWRSDMFPGPPTLPIIGNLHQLTVPIPLFLQLKKLHQKYGEYLSLKIGSKTMLVIGDDGTAIRELLDKRGAIYSNRAEHVFARTSGDGHLLIERNHQVWRESRKLIISHFSPSVSEEYAGIQEAESTQLLLELLYKPESSMHHPVRFAASVLTSVTYGFRAPEYSHPGCHGVATPMAESSDTRKPTFMVPLEAFPLLQYLPDFFLGSWRKYALKLRQHFDELYRDLAELGQERARKGLNRDAFLNVLYGLQLSEKRIHYLAGVVLEGGSEIVGIAILTAMLALVANPDIQRKAQIEIDSICDEDHLPTWQDHEHMPYIGMIAKETLRWRPPFPLGVSHALDEEDTWKGWFMPKGSKGDCSQYMWARAIHMNPKRYPNPEQFIPERFESHLSSMVEYQHHPDPRRRDHFAFGSGRRHCPGIQLTEQALFISISRILWAFNLSVPEGHTVDTAQETAFVGFSARRPKDFPLVVTLRSEKRLEVIERERRYAEDNIFSQFG